jgi:hypothetical protein
MAANRGSPRGETIAAADVPDVAKSGQPFYGVFSSTFIHGETLFASIICPMHDTVL